MPQYHGEHRFCIQETQENINKIVTTSAGRMMNFKIYGLKEDGDYDIEIKSTKTEQYHSKQHTQQTRHYHEGRKSSSKDQMDQHQSHTKFYKQNGVTVKTEKSYPKTHIIHNQIIARGTK